MRDQHTFENRGRNWQCAFDKASGHWTAVHEEFRICAPSWDDLKEELKVLDLSVPRVDGVAVAEPLPGIGSMLGM